MTTIARPRLGLDHPQFNHDGRCNWTNRVFSSFRKILFTSAALGASCAAFSASAKVTKSMSEIVHSPEGELQVYQTGGGTPVLFLHADSGRASQWDAVRSRLGSDYHTISFDFRGSGQSSSAANSDYSYKGRAEDIAAVIKGLHLDRVVLVAHSGSGPAALIYAADHVGKVAGILLVDPPTDPRKMPANLRDSFLTALAGPDSLKAQKDYYTSIAGKNPATLACVLADTEPVRPEARLGFGQALAEWNPEPTLDAWHGPIKILFSQMNDTPSALFRLRPTIAHQLVPNAGHWLQVDQPDVVEMAIRDFITKLSVAGAETNVLGNF